MERCITVINNKDLKKSMFENAQFIFFAESGAMGEAGKVLIMTSEGGIFHGNYCLGDIKLKKLYRSIPVLKACNFVELGDGTNVPEDWKYEYLGAGNHLIIRNDVYADFKEKLKDAEYPEDFYQSWFEAAGDIVEKQVDNICNDGKKTIMLESQNRENVATIQNYNEFVKEVQEKYKNEGKGVVEYAPCDIWMAGNQINLWTYWQGYQIKNIEKGVDILLVGQDWGNPKRQSDTIDRIIRIQNGDKQVNYADSTNPTDRMLIRLFSRLGYDIKSENPGCRIFFTNYSLGYRTGSETGGMTKTLLLEDKEYFQKLVKIIKPKNIICLGKLVYEVVAGKSVNGFLAQLKNGMPLMSTYPEDDKIKVFGVPHCGARGVSNVGGYNKMEMIWDELGKYIIL